jgi:opacity protein-like surface antigen
MVLPIALAGTTACMFLTGFFFPELLVLLAFSLLLTFFGVNFIVLGILFRKIYGSIQAIATKAKPSAIPKDEAIAASAVSVAPRTGPQEQRSLHLLGFLRFAILFATALAFSVSAAEAQSSSTSSSDLPSSPEADQGFHLGITPYLWFSGVNGTVGALGHEASVHASASDVLDNFDIGFMIAAEPRYNRIVFPIDYMYVKLSDNKGLPFDQGYYSVKVTMTESILTQKIGYRFVDKRRFKVDALWGYRYWHLTNSLVLQPVSPLGGISASRGWVDAVSGAKFEIGLTKKAFVTVFGDAGGANAKYDYQVGGVVGFRIARKWALQAGYRYMAVKYGSPSNFLYNVAQSGVVLGATWNPK